MSQNEFAIKLLAFLANGGTVEHLIVELPLSKARINSAFDWLKTGGRCSASEVVIRAKHLREIVRQKHDAIEHKDFELAVRKRAEECAVYESFWLGAATGKSDTIALGDVAEQIKIMGEMLRVTDAIS